MGPGGSLNSLDFFFFTCPLILLSTEVGRSIWTQLEMPVNVKKACFSFVKQMDSIIMANEGHIDPQSRP